MDFVSAREQPQKRHGEKNGAIGASVCLETK